MTTKSAVLEADVDPEGEATTYHFEYGAADCSANPCASIPVPDGNVGSGSSPVRIKREIDGLAPGTTYHFRAVATNGSGTSPGPDRTFATYEPPSSATGCPNQGFRVGASAALPDCRAYEMVTPIEKNGADIFTLCNINCYRTALNQASLSGDRLAFSSYKAFGGQLSNLYSNQYIATRGPSGWSTDGINPPHGRTPFSPEFSTWWDLELLFKAMSAELDKTWVTDDSETPLVPEALPGEVNLLGRDNLTNGYEQIAPQEPFAFNQALEVQGNSPDGSHLVFSTGRALTTEAPVSPDVKLYDFTAGEVKLASILPGGTPSPENGWLGMASSTNNGRYATVDRAVSEDGSRIVWTETDTTFGGVGKIYQRIDGTTTKPVSELVSAADAQYWTASADGAEVLFTIGDNLYAADVDAGTTTLVAPKALGVLGASADASYVYFVSTAVLDAGATEGQPNLYLDHEGTKTLVATLSKVDIGQGQGIGIVSGYDVIAPAPINHASRVSADGLSVAFQSIGSLTGYDNTDAKNGEPDLEVFVYRADGDQLICVSCRPSGERPVGQPLQQAFRSNDSPANNNGGPERRWTAAWLTTAERQMYSPRALSDDGERLFFNAFDGLVPQDNNGRQDVYQWEAQGKGSCDRPAGCVSLISTGESPENSEFVDASPLGRDVFFSTSSGIDSRDRGLIDIYNARDGGGYPPPPAPPAPCLGDACQTVPPAPPVPTPSSAEFRGAGNPKPVRLRHRCRARNHKGKRGKKAGGKQSHGCKRGNRRAGR